jgi:hypothetical protein
VDASNTVQSIISESELQCAESFFEQVKKLGWEQTKEHLKLFLESNELKSEEEKSVFLDLLISSCIRSFQPSKDATPFWDMLGLWLDQRKLPQRVNALSQKEITVLTLTCTNLREKLKQVFGCCVLSGVILDESQQWTVITLWRLLFLNPFSATNSYTSALPKETVELFKGMGYPGFLIASMYYPFCADEFTIDMESLWDSELPMCYKAVITFWFLATPYFQVNDRHRRKLTQNITPICNALKNHSEGLSTKLFITFVEEAMTAFWRVSYSGGNNVAALSSFGDFIGFQMSKLCAWDNKMDRRKVRKHGDKIKVGYISRNFHRQAVSFYMVNRVIHHDPNQFDVHVFVVGEYHDVMTDLFEQHAEHFQHFPNILDFAAIIRAILSSDLDILIYTDIGMDPITYILSGLQLAPVQCALVGHGTTTGMPTIQYYLSGDFESTHAQVQYRERLIRLPNLGAAQHLAGQPEEVITRAELGIPEDAVVFISCANGIKHGVERDALLVKILQKVPNAWIILKPFASRSGMDHHLAQRVKAAANSAGVEDRLLIVSPVSHPASVMGLLKIADIQLDTYPYGGWTTNLEALYCGLPIVTQEGELSRSRWGAAMLRSLGVSEGIAHTPEQYVDWSLKLAADSSLRQEICEKIKANVVATLFNGPEAQKSYENELLKIYQQTAKIAQLPHSATEVISSKPMTILTSIMPGNEVNQRTAIATWKQQGFHVVSINCAEERYQLAAKFPDIAFVTAQRDGRSKWGKPYVYFDDLLTYFRHSDYPICGIVNSDICLWKENLLQSVTEAAENSFLFGSRIDVDSLSSMQGNMYHAGFDYFFFDRRVLDLYPPEEFCLGLPWWDYWAALLPLIGPDKVPCKRVTTPIALHVKHPANWDIQSWLEMGNTLGKYLRPPFTLSQETMPRFLSETVTIIHKLSQPVSL